VFCPSPLLLSPSCVTHKKTLRKKFHASIFFFSLRFTYRHVQLSERGNTPSLMAILGFVKQKRFVGQGCLESLSLRCFRNQLRRERRLRKSKKKTTTIIYLFSHKINKTTTPSKIDAICAQNVWKFIFMLGFSLFRTSKDNFPQKVY